MYRPLEVEVARLIKRSCRMKKLPLSPYKSLVYIALSFISAIFTTNVISLLGNHY